MAKDYARNRYQHKKSSRGSKSGSIRPWIIMGILIGIVIAAAAYMKMQRAHMFSEQMADANKPAPTKQQKPPPPTKVPQPHFDFYTVLPKDEKTVTAAPGAEKANVNPANLLSPQPAQEVAVPEPQPQPQSQSEQAQEPKVTTVELPPEPAPSREQMLAEEKQKLEREIALAAQQAMPTSKMPAVNVSKNYVLSTGIFKDYAAADEERAKLVLQGIEANIKKIQKNGQTLYRVWMGPYSSLKSAQQQQKRLQANLIKATLIKED